MKKFDWEFAAKTRSPRRVQWLKDNHLKPVTEDQFVAAMCMMKGDAARKGKGKNYQPSRLRKQYRNLRITFGFFPIS